MCTFYLTFCSVLLSFPCFYSRIMLEKGKEVKYRGKNFFCQNQWDNYYAPTEFSPCLPVEIVCNVLHFFAGVRFPLSVTHFFHFSERGKNLLPSLALYALDSPCRRRCVLAARDAEDKRIIFTSAVKMPLKLTRGEVITQLLLHYKCSPPMPSKCESLVLQ